MGAHTIPRTSEGAIDLKAAADQMIDWLDVAAANGWETYYPVWTRLLASVGGSAGFVWEDVWPVLHVGYRDEAFDGAGGPMNIKAGDALVEHLMRQGFRRDLLRSLLGDSDGTLPDADDFEIGRATSQVVSDFLLTGGRILIDTAGRLTEGPELPRSWGKFPKLDDEIMAAARAYMIATCCPRAIPGLRMIVEDLGTRHDNGWIELTSDPRPLEVAFSGWKRGLSVINGDEVDDTSAGWALFDFAEHQLLEIEERGPRAAEVMLWMLIQSQTTDRDANHGCQTEDLDRITRHERDISFEASLTIKAMRALQEAAHA